MTLGLLSVCAALLGAAPSPTPIPLPEGQGGIGFDDLGYSSALHRVIVPAGRSGKLDLVDPKTLAVESVEGFSAQARFAGGHGVSCTSADSGRGLLFASDRSNQIVVVADPHSHKTLASAPLAAGPDYVRWVEPLGEVWVTEPRKRLIECFRLDPTSKALTHVSTLTIDDGPESLVLDPARGRAYTHTWHDQTVAVELATHKVVARWGNGCKGARGIALDGPRGLLFVGCEEGKATTLDVAHDGKQVGEVAAGKGVDIIAYSAALGHLYVPGGDDATLSFVKVGPKGELSLLGTAPTAEDAHCAASDEEGNVYVCDPGHGRLLRFHDPFPSSR